ncbi:MAG: proton-conducting transporter membrane subunit, partial [Myxococcota bacterium]
MVGLFLALFVALLSVPFVGGRGRISGALLAVAPASGFAWLLARLLTAGFERPEVYRVSWVASLGVDFALRLDGLSGFFALLILGVGALILIYAGSYLSEHRDLERFFITLLIFMASMLGLVLADDAITLFVFWEGTSLTSYLLIGFDHEERSARVAARKALLITGTGGLALLGGLILLHHMTGTWALSAWVGQRELILGHPLAGVAMALVLVGAFTKSAQVPFHFWLPAAMAGPTPVSAYLHSATMVKAGVFLLARLSPIWRETEGWWWSLTTFGAVTMLFSAWCALRQRDLKGVLAFTTTMALGLLVMLLGQGDEAAILAAMTYLLVHALYKGALFMTAGIVDHGAHTRDLDRLSGLRAKMPFTALATGVACASMAGIPLLLGFVGKELAYEANLHAGTPGLVVLAVSILANAALFAVSGILALKPFFGAPSEAAEHAHEGDASLLFGPLILGAGSLAFGLVPGLLDGLVEPAASVVMGAHAHAHLALWHGFTPALAASLVTYGLGAGIYSAAGSVVSSPALAAFARGFAEAPGRLFERALLLLVTVSKASTQLIYPGRLRRYVMMTVVGLGVAAAIRLFSVEQFRLPEVGLFLPHEMVLLVLLVVSSGIATFAEPAMRAIIAVGISGYCVALVYLLFG